VIGSPLRALVALGLRRKIRADALQCTPAIARPIHYWPTRKSPPSNSCGDTSICRYTLEPVDQVGPRTYSGLRAHPVARSLLVFKIRPVNWPLPDSVDIIGMSPRTE